MHWKLKKSGIIVASASAALATWTSTEACLFDKLFERQRADSQQASGQGCIFSCFPTKWRPWETCREEGMPPVPSITPELVPNDSPVLTVPADRYPPDTILRDDRQPLHVPTDPAGFPGTGISPPPGTPGIESSIPVPSRNGILQVPDQFPLPPLHSRNRSVDAPPDGGIYAPSSPDSEIVVPPGASPDTLIPAGAPNFSPVPQPAVPADSVPLPGSPESGSLRTPSAGPPAERFTVPPAPGTAQFVPMKPYHLQTSGLQTMSHTVSSDRQQFHGPDESGWRVMRGYYGNPSGQVSSARRSP